MKKLLLIAIIIFAATISNALGQTAKEIKLSANAQAVDKGSKFTFKLIEVEDSRCPADVNCVWAGNAKVKLSIAKGKSAAKTFELNTALEPNIILYQGYEITLKDVSPARKSTDTSPISYSVKLSLSKMTKAK